MRMFTNSAREAPHVYQLHLYIWEVTICGVFILSVAFIVHVFWTLLRAFGPQELLVPLYLVYYYAYHKALIAINSYQCLCTLDAHVYNKFSSLLLMLGDVGAYKIFMVNLDMSVTAPTQPSLTSQ